MNIKNLAAFLPLMPLSAAAASGVSLDVPQKPNVIFIIIDDQGKSDLSCYGNPWVRTPNIDNLYSDAIRLDNYHTSPLSAPARAAIMTGHYPIRNGEWATFKGRDILTPDMPKMSEIFKANGYSTAMFGKWHMGDNYPSRPIDCGFDYVVAHKAGGVSEMSDYWGNTYFDDVYYTNEEPMQYEGYCTDVFFDEAIKFIDLKSKKEEPFFVYLATNSPHSPHYVAEKYAAPFRDGVGTKFPSAEYWGMLVNLDENVGRLEQYLEENGLSENTAVVYVTDNGGTEGTDGERFGYNLGMRGKKKCREEGGHTVPFFIRWPEGGLCGGEDRAALTAHVDIIPTFASLFDLELPAGATFDGIDVSKVITGGDEFEDKDRSVFVHHRQDSKPPHPTNESCVLYQNWRLINGEELFDLDSDPYQEHDVADKFPEIKAKMLKDNALFIDESKKFPQYQDFIRPIVGAPEQKVSVLTIQHAIGTGAGFWRSEQVSEGFKSANDTYAIEVAESGVYRISCNRWPRECIAKIWEMPTYNPKNFYTYKTIHPEEVVITVNGKEYRKSVTADDTSVDFEIPMKKGKVMLTSNFVENGKKFGVYYNYVEKIR